MAVLHSLRDKVSGKGGRSGARVVAMARGRRRRVSLRRAVAMVLAPLMVSGNSLMPVIATAGLAAGVTAAGVVAAAPAKAAVSGPVLVLLQNGETTAPETTV
jgi:hypothetical protein